MNEPTGAWATLRRVFRLPQTRRRMRAELDDEFRFHLEGRIEELMEREGLAREQAEYEARRRFGDFDTYRQQVRNIDDSMLHRRSRMELLDTIRRETNHAARALLRAPSFSLVAVITLALGLGAATAIFTLLDRVVLRPLPYPNADRLIHIGTLWRMETGGTDEYRISRGQYFYFKHESATMSDFALYDTQVSIVPGDGDHPAERVNTVESSASVFSVLGIRPELGHVFSVDEERAQNKTVALISHDYWQRRFGGDPGIVGRRLQLGWGPSVEIIGVLPHGANLPDVKADIWTRNQLDPNDKPANNHTHHGIGVLKPGVTVAMAAADVKHMQALFVAAHPEVYPASFMTRTGMAMHVTSLRDSIVGESVVRAFWLLFAAVAFVLLIAAANVANLFLLRIDARRREVAVRTALGAGRGELAVHYLAESLMLGGVAAVGAIALAYGLLHGLLAIAPQSLPRLDEVTIGWRSVTFCAASAIAFGVVFGLLPLGSIGVDVAVLRDAGRGLTTSRPRELARRALVLTQIALAVVLLSGAALMLKSFSRLRHVQLGFNPVGVQTMTLILPASKYLTYQQVEPFWRDLMRRVEALPSVTHAGATNNLPFGGGFGCTSVATEAAGDRPADVHCMSMVFVTPGYFEAMGVKVAGTLPTWSSVEAGAAPVIVSGVVARRFWKDVSPIGHVVEPFNPRMPQFPITGIAEDMYGNGLRSPLVDAIYFPIVPPSDELTAKFGPGSWASRYMSLVVRAPNADPGALVTAIRQIVTQMDPQVPIADVQSMEIIVAQSMADTSFTMSLLLIAATIAMLLSAVGIYGVISYIVGQRRVEIGIRLALGAQVREVSRLIVGQSLVLATAGIAAGVMVALAATRFLGSLLFEVSPTDPTVLGGTALLLLVVAVAASVGPTRRAARIDPVEAMRQ
ncbi:MAG: ABC transporter permease [bacterium]